MAINVSVIIQKRVCVSLPDSGGALMTSGFGAMATACAAPSSGTGALNGKLFAAESLSATLSEVG